MLEVGMAAVALMMFIEAVLLIWAFHSLRKRFNDKLKRK